MFDIETKRHSLAHILAHAVKTLYPEVKFGIGPDIDNGFYYDFDFTNCKTTPGEEDLKKIQKQMYSLLEKDVIFEKKEIAKQEALDLFKDNEYKTELINELEDGTISIYTSGDFTDLCKGPHVDSSKDLKDVGFKLAKLAGAYWRGDEKNPMLTRIYAYAFSSNEELDDYLIKLEEAKKRDHRILGQKLDLFHIDDEVGPGLILWHPNGALLKRLIETYTVDQYMKNGCQVLCTPHIAKLNLWQTSGHADFYAEGMFPSFNLSEKDENEKIDYQLKPMNCPFHIMIYKNDIHSYRELPIRYTELGTVYRYEKSGTLHGLTRVRGFTQDDAHIFCEEKDIAKEIMSSLDLIFKMFADFGFKEYTIYLSTKPDKAIGDDAIWEKAESAIKEGLKGKEYKIDEKGGAFYGPKIDIKVKDAIGREWQLSTIQIDFNLAERFDITYIDSNGEKKRPIMLHRAILGSIERFIGVFLEHHAGNIPFDFAPEQVWVMPISENFKDYAEEITQKLKDNNIRVSLKNDDSIGKRIRSGEMKRIPYLLIVGEKEKQAGTVAVRERNKGETGVIPIEEFISNINKSA